MRTLFDKVWAAHEVVAETPDTPAVLYIDLHLIHEVTSPQAFSVLKGLGLKVRRPDRTLATMDHSIPTSSDQVFGRVPIKGGGGEKRGPPPGPHPREFGWGPLGQARGGGRLRPRNRPQPGAHAP